MTSTSDKPMDDSAYQRYLNAVDDGTDERATGPDIALALSILAIGAIISLALMYGLWRLARGA